MKLIAAVLVGAGLALAGLALQQLSADAIGMAIGMALGTLAIVPAVVLVVVAAQRGGQTTYYGLDDGHMNLRGDGLDGTLRRDPVQPVVIVVQEPAAANTGRFRVAWQSDETAITPYGGNTTRWAAPVDGVVLVAGQERERRPVWATEPVGSAIASGGLCLVRADEWDAWQRQRGG